MGRIDAAGDHERKVNVLVCPYPGLEECVEAFVWPEEAGEQHTFTVRRRHVASVRVTPVRDDLYGGGARGLPRPLRLIAEHT
jgi:hypothetical protein